MTERSRVKALISHQTRKENKSNIEAPASLLPPVQTIEQELAVEKIVSSLALSDKTFSMLSELGEANREQDFLGQSCQQRMGQSTAAECQESSKLQTEYYRVISELARAEIEQQAGKALLTQTTQSPAFIMSLLH